MKPLLTKRKLKFRQTDRKSRFLFGGVIAILLVTTPFLFYLYKYAPADSDTWETSLITIKSGGFTSVQGFMHQLISKGIFVLMTTLWFITSRDWWKWAILVPLIMFLFQLSGVVNYQIDYIDKFDFWYALPVITPVIIILIWVSHELNKVVGDLDLKDEIEDELERYNQE